MIRIVIEEGDCKTRSDLRVWAHGIAEQERPTRFDFRLKFDGTL